MSEAAIMAAAEVVGRSRHLGVFIGSGLSLASGVPTYRDAQGNYIDDAVARYSQASTFQTDRQAMLWWYETQRRKLRAIHPNAGHRAIARIARRIRTVCVTQNVDGLLERAIHDEGSDAEVFALHGRVDRTRCHVCRQLEYRPIDLADEPLCRACGGSLRPDVVWFGEPLERHVWQAAEDAFLEIDVCLIVGTSGMVYPATALPELAEHRGIQLIEINVAETSLSNACQHALRGHAEAILPVIAEALSNF